MGRGAESFGSHRCGICGQSEKVGVTAVSGLSVYRWPVPDRLGDGFSSTCQTASPCDSSSPVPGREILPIPDLVTLTGSHGGLYSGGPICSSLHETDSTLPSQVLVSTASAEAHDHCSVPSVSTSALVVQSHQSSVRFAPLPSKVCSCTHDRCIWRWLGRGTRQPPVSSGFVVGAGSDLAYQSTRVASSVVGSSTLSSSASGSVCVSSNGQLHDLPLYQQVRGHSVCGVVSSGLGSPSLVSTKGHYNSSFVCSGSSQSYGRCSFPGQRFTLSTVRGRPARMVSQSSGGQSAVHSIGSPVVRLVRLPNKLQTSSVVQLGQGSSCLSLERFFPSLDSGRLCFSTSCSTSSSCVQDQAGPSYSHPHRPLLASESLGLRSSPYVSRSPHQASPPSGFTATTRSVPPRSSVLASSGMESVRRSYVAKGFSTEVIHTLQASRRSSTTGAYEAQWSVFDRWCCGRGEDPFRVDLALVLEFLNDMFHQGKAYNTLKGYLSAFTAFRGSIQGYTFHQHPDIATFLKGVLRLRPPVRSPVPCWDLDLVLNFLSSHIFEPPDSATLDLWTLKTVFLVAITSVARVSELQAIDIRPELSRIRRNSVSLRANPSFLPKVLNAQYVNRQINIQAFHPDPRNKLQRQFQLLCPVRALNIYLDKTRSFRRPQIFQLFVSYKSGSEGLPVSKQRIASWLVSTIAKAYSHFDMQVPQGIRAHSTRAVGASVACVRGVLLEDICRAATWADGSVFAKFYCLDMVPEGTSLSHTILSRATRT